MSIDMIFDLISKKIKEYWFLLILSLIFLLASRLEIDLVIFYTTLFATLIGVFVAYILGRANENRIHNSDFKRKRTRLLMLIRSELFTNKQRTKLLIEIVSEQIEIFDEAKKDNITEEIRVLGDSIKKETFLALQSSDFFNSINVKDFFENIFSVYSKIDIVKTALHLLEMKGEANKVFEESDVSSIKKVLQQVKTHCEQLEDLEMKTLTLIDFLLKKEGLTIHIE